MGERPNGDDADPSASRGDPPLDALPDAYAAVLRGLAAGTPASELADLAGIEPAALDSFLRVAVAKLLDLGDENA